MSRLWLGVTGSTITTATVSVGGYGPKARRQIRDRLDAIGAGREPRVTGLDLVRALEVIDAARIQRRLDGERGRGRLPDYGAIPRQLAVFAVILQVLPADGQAEVQIEIRADPRLRHKSRK